MEIITICIILIAIAVVFGKDAAKGLLGCGLLILAFLLAIALLGG